MPDQSALQLVHDLFDELRKRRRFPIGPTDLDALRIALTAGFGWSSSDELRELIIALWAKSTREAATIASLFARLPWPESWTAEAMERPVRPPEGAIAEPLRAAPSAPVDDATPPPAPMESPVTRRVGSLPPLSLRTVKVSDARLILVEQYPLSHREIAQAFRRLRRPVRLGPATELDVDATVQRRSHSALVTPPVLVARRRNAARLAMFVDVQGSMAPFTPFVDAFCEAVVEAGLLRQTLLHYFHDVPSAGGDRRLLEELDQGAFFPTLDPVLSRIEARRSGEVYADRAMQQGVELRDVLRDLAPGTAAVIVSDAGAARACRDPSRLLDCAAFVKGLRRHTTAVVWLNPVPRAHWANTVAIQLARHVPMYSLDREGIAQSVSALRGQPVKLERPL